MICHNCAFHMPQVWQAVFCCVAGCPHHNPSYCLSTKSHAAPSQQARLVLIVSSQMHLPLYAKCVQLTLPNCWEGADRFPAPSQQLRGVCCTQQQAVRCTCHLSLYHTFLPDSCWRGQLYMHLLAMAKEPQSQTVTNTTLPNPANIVTTRCSVTATN